MPQRLHRLCCKQEGVALIAATYVDNAFFAGASVRKATEMAEMFQHTLEHEWKQQIKATSWKIECMKRIWAKPRSEEASEGQRAKSNPKHTTVGSTGGWLGPRSEPNQHEMMERLRELHKEEPRGPRGPPPTKEEK